MWCVGLVGLLAYWPLVCFHLRATHIDVCVCEKGGGGLMIGLTAVSGATFAAATLADSGQNVNHKC